MPVGEVTRGTTGTNRLRRVDRFVAAHPSFTRAEDPLVVDLGYGASGTTAFELAERLRRVVPTVSVLGLEIEPSRVARAREQLALIRAGGTSFPRDLPVDFAAGGFEVPAPRPPRVIRALNVLRQYAETDVAPAWQLMIDRLDDDGILVEGTCSESGRVASWVTLSRLGPQTFTVSLRLGGLAAPSVAAERLPKALIHRNVPGERIHAFLTALDDAWTRSSALAPFGPRQRFLATADRLGESGWRILGKRERIRLGEITVPWEDVRPPER